MKYFIFLFLSTSLFANTVWITGTTKMDLIKVSNKGYVSKSCESTCSLKTLVKNNRTKLSSLDFSGGKDPASVFCKEIGSEVIYMSHEDLLETFCIKGDDVISLSLLLD